MGQVHSNGCRSRQSCFSAEDNPDGGVLFLTLDFGSFDDFDLDGPFAVLRFGSFGKCASHFGGSVGARTATEYSQIMFLSSGGSVNSKHSLQRVSKRQKSRHAGKSLTLDHTHLGAPEIHP